MGKRANLELVEGGYIVGCYSNDNIFEYRSVHTNIIDALVKLALHFEPLAAIGEVDLARAVEKAMEVQDG